MATNYAHPEVLVETDWLAQHLDDPKVRVVEIDVDREAYDKGHIPGAVGWDWSRDLGDPLRRDLPSAADFGNLLSKSGIAPDTNLILYGDNNNWFAAFGFWVLKIYGHDNVKLLNGGRKKWEAEGRELIADKPNIKPAQYKTSGDRQKELRSFRDEVVQHYRDTDTVLVDVRSPQEFTGEILSPPGLPETCQRGGHIPGARNIPWGKAVNEDGTFKSADELKKLYESEGVTPSKNVIAYCRIGERSAHTWFVLSNLLGYRNVKNYDGSWTEWGNIVNAPVEREIPVTTR